MSDLPPLAALRVFEAAARHSNFTRAAEELGMTQAAVSYQIKLLEERSGGPLFLRKSRQVELTELGRRLAGPVTEAFDLIRGAFSSVRQEAQGVLVINWCSLLISWSAMAKAIGWSIRKAGGTTARSAPSGSGSSRWRGKRDRNGFSGHALACQWLRVAPPSTRISEPVT